MYDNVILCTIPNAASVSPPHLVVVWTHLDCVYNVGLLARTLYSD